MIRPSHASYHLGARREITDLRWSNSRSCLLSCKDSDEWQSKALRSADAPARLEGLPRRVTGVA